MEPIRVVFVSGLLNNCNLIGSKRLACFRWDRLDCLRHVDLVCCLAVHADCGRSARHSWCSRVLRCKVVLVRLVACACTVSPCFERAAYLRGEQAQHHVFCVAAESVAWRTRGRRVEGCGTFRGTVVEGEDARSKCWVLYNNDGLCYALGRRRYTVVDDAERTVVRRTRALARAACKTCTAK